MFHNVTRLETHISHNILCQDRPAPDSQMFDAAVMTIIVDKNQQQHGFVATIWAKTGLAVLEYFLNKRLASSKIPSIIK